MRSESQYVPVNPAAQSQVVTIPGPSRHVPPLRQVVDVQKKRPVEQFDPLKPSAHILTYMHVVSIIYHRDFHIHVPPFTHFSYSHFVLSCTQQIKYSTITKNSIMQDKIYPLVCALSFLSTEKKHMKITTTSTGK